MSWEKERVVYEKLFGIWKNVYKVALKDLLSCAKLSVSWWNGSREKNAQLLDVERRK